MERDDGLLATLRTTRRVCADPAHRMGLMGALAVGVVAVAFFMWLMDTVPGRPYVGFGVGLFMAGTAVTAWAESADEDDSR